MDWEELCESWCEREGELRNSIGFFINWADQRLFIRDDSNAKWIVRNRGVVQIAIRNLKTFRLAGNRYFKRNRDLKIDWPNSLLFEMEKRLQYGNPLVWRTWVCVRGFLVSLTHDVNAAFLRLEHERSERYKLEKRRLEIERYKEERKERQEQQRIAKKKAEEVRKQERISEEKKRRLRNLEKAKSWQPTVRKTNYVLVPGLGDQIENTKLFRDVCCGCGEVIAVRSPNVVNECDICIGESECGSKNYFRHGYDPEYQQLDYHGS